MKTNILFWISSVVIFFSFSSPGIAIESCTYSAGKVSNLSSGPTQYSRSFTKKGSRAAEKAKNACH